MRWKLLTLLTVLALMVSTVPPLKVKAQGLVEYALILVLVPVGIGETAEILWQKPNPGNSEEPIPLPPFATTQSFTIKVTNTGNSNCLPQVVTTTVDSVPGLNALTLERMPTTLIINGQEEAIAECLGVNNPVAFQVGIPWTPGLTDEGGADLTARGYELQNVQIKSWAIVGTADGATHAVTVVNNHYSSKGTTPPPSREVVLGVGTDQSLNVYLNLQRRGVPSASDDSEPGLAGATISLSLSPTENSHVCTQKFQLPLNPAPGLQTLALGIGSDEDGRKLLINGALQEPPLDGDCFDEAERVAFILGDLNAYTMEDPLTATSAGLERIGGIMIYDVTDPSGATQATGFVDDAERWTVALIDDF